MWPPYTDLERFKVLTIGWTHILCHTLSTDRGEDRHIPIISHFKREIIESVKDALLKDIAERKERNETYACIYVPKFLPGDMPERDRLFLSEEQRVVCSWRRSPWGGYTCSTSV